MTENTINRVELKIRSFGVENRNDCDLTEGGVLN